MRVLFDTNILVSYLLRPRGPIQMIVNAAISGAYELLMPKSLLIELAVTISAREELAERIPAELLAEFFEDLETVATVIPPIMEELIAVTRGPKDDYLIVYAIAGEADVLVSKDRDLLVLGQTGNLSFLSPADFAHFLEVNP